MKIQYVWNSTVNPDEWTIDLDTKGLLWIQVNLSEVLHMGGHPADMKEAADAYYKIEEAIKERDQKQATETKDALVNDPTIHSNTEVSSWTEKKDS